MYTQCPHCKSAFQITAEQLKLANGDVRCGHCLSIFSALGHLSENIPEQAPTTTEHNADKYSEWADEVLNVSLDTPTEDSPELFTETLETGTQPEFDGTATVNLTEENEIDSEFAEFFAGTSPENRPEDAIIIEKEDLAPLTSPDYSDSLEEAQTANAEAEPASIQQNPTKTINVPARIFEDMQAENAAQLRPSSAPWAIGNILLMLALILQVAYFTRDELAKDPTFRPWLVQMCEFAKCTLAQPFDIRQIEIIGRDVRTHPTARKALIASTTIINNANFVQPYPLLTLVFSNINGTLLAQRRFMPREYLSSNIDISSGMTPNLPIQVELKLVDPGKAAVNYEFHAETDPRSTHSIL